jgi:hypothetical protein
VSGEWIRVGVLPILYREDLFYCSLSGALSACLPCLSLIVVCKSSSLLYSAVTPRFHMRHETWEPCLVLTTASTSLAVNKYSHLRTSKLRKVRRSQSVRFRICEFAVRVSNFPAFSRICTQHASIFAT